MPCYNAGKYIKEAINSVLNQSYKDLELIIIDDGSTDESLHIIDSFNDTRIVLYKQEHLGACVARNKGIALAKGEYIKFLDADDILFLDCLSNQISQIHQLKSNQIPFGDYCHIDDKGELLGCFLFEKNNNMLSILEQDQPFFFFNYWHVLISAPLLRREDLIKIGGFDIDLKRGQEFDLHFRLALSGVEFIYLPCNTFSYREYTSESRITSRGRVDKKMMEEYALQRVLKVEKLLNIHYGRIPTKYSSFFVNYWFSRAREEFSKKDKAQGIENLYKSMNYEYRTPFMLCYRLIGNLIGFINLESVLRFRLKLIGK